MRLKSAALFAVGLLFFSFWMHGGARCQSSPASPLSLAPPPSVTDQGSPPAATCHWTGLNRWCSNPAGPGVLSPRPTAKDSPPPAAENVSPPMATDVPARTATTKGSPPVAAKNVSPPMATDDVPAPTATAKRSPPPVAKNVSPPMATDDVPAPTAPVKRSARSAAAKNSPQPANDRDAPALDNPSQKPAADYDGFTVGIDDGEETSQPLPTKPRPKQSKVRQKADVAERPSSIQSLGDQAEIEKLKPNLSICRGC